MGMYRQWACKRAHIIQMSSVSIYVLHKVLLYNLKLVGGSQTVSSRLAFAGKHTPGDACDQARSQLPSKLRLCPPPPLVF